MIKLFRNIRKNLLTEGKTTKYFKYAIGEIILVVIGIIIALQINTWNENRKQSMEEKEILTSLFENLVFAKQQSQDLIQIEKESKALLIQILKLGIDNQENDILTDTIFKIAVWDIENSKPTFNIYSSLKNTNKLSLIKSNAINQKFTDLEIELNKLDDILADRLNVQQLRIDKLLENEINFIPLIKENIPELNIENESVNNYDEVIKLKVVRNLLGMKLTFTQDVIDFRENLDRAIAELLSVIKADLDKK
jgi:hypothetical protein